MRIEYFKTEMTISIEEKMSHNNFRTFYKESNMIPIEKSKHKYDFHQLKLIYLVISSRNTRNSMSNIQKNITFTKKNQMTSISYDIKSGFEMISKKYVCKILLK